MNKFLACLTVLALALGSSSAGSSRPSYNTAGAVSARSAAKATSQVLDCYDYTSQGGDRVRAIDYIPALSNYNFDNRISSCCFTGIWLLYAENDYNDRDLGGANYWAYGNNFCTSVPAQFDNVASSLRYTGAPDGWEYDVLNLYFNDFFIGGEEFMYQDAPQLNYDNRAKSVIVTGCSAWTIYAGTNYSGDSMCVWPKDTSNCYPG